MKHLALQPVDPRGTRCHERSPSNHHGRAWLRRAGQHLVERKLDAAMEALVRQEKYSSALIMSLRIFHDLEKPLRDLERHIDDLERLAAREPEVSRLVSSLRRDRRAILRAIRRLRRLEPPPATAA